MTGRIPTVVCGVALLTSACATSGAVPRPFPGAAIPPGVGTPATPPGTSPPDTPLPGTPLADAPSTVAMAPLVALALTYRGTPYRNGGSDPSGFDCSGFVQWVFAQYGRALPREVRDQFALGKKIDRGDVEPGDLVFFETVSRGASHVGIALGGNRFVHAPSSRGVVRVESYEIDYWKRRYVGARRME